MEQRKTTVKTEIKNGKKIVTTTTIATTDLNPMNLDEPQGAFLKCPVELPVTIAPKTKHTKGDFQRKALERHNYYRFLHGVPPLEWCSKCASKAQAYANHLAKTQSLEHSHDKSWGENLFTSTGSREPVISDRPLHSARLEGYDTCWNGVRS
ncbi:uncharacterized protein LOC111261211 isoform X2 [Varroa jacobsoni]|uniref:SCP domain-containing protein n=1 Tax=Varroa destructor TaxID=109461 RepID=A0A7M7IXH0_VARDE|nr:uncharacterized protein LOC111243113 isoform X2 [Varroa destructor]XP_022690261.1 uncharacterized protein LOC111261211 isoform X2 [Varroa jacobsoni]